MFLLRNTVHVILPYENLGKTPTDFKINQITNLYHLLLSLHLCKMAFPTCG